MNKSNQVIEYLENGNVRVYNIVDMHLGDEADPLTTVVVSGYEDISLKEE